MSSRERKRVLVTGFGRFPGAPENPTEALVRALARSRRPAFAGLDIVARVLPVTWSGLPRLMEALIREINPAMILMLGLAGSASRIRVETRAANVANRLRVDARGGVAPRAALVGAGPRALSCRADARRVLSAIRSSGVPAELSSDAGTYLCNASLWSALAGTQRSVPVIFIHIPRGARRRPRLRPGRPRPTVTDMIRAAAAALLALRLPPCGPAQASPPTQTYFTSR